MKDLRAHDYSQRGQRAFTLVEVLLAVGILSGLLVVVLYFYQQATQLRTELLLDTERSSSARLLMERLTTELRAARAHTFYAVPLVGGATWLQFITTDLPSQTAWAGEHLGRVSRPETDLKLVSYRKEVSREDTNLVGLARSEEPLVEFRTPGVNESAVVLPSSETNKPNSVVVTEAFHFVRFRYWDGHAWTESWNGTILPGAVEVMLGSEPPPAETEPGEYAGEVFRRVIYLPGSVRENSDPLLDFPIQSGTRTAKVGR
jgi:prepilin-type N-terminal cleavage/methylation domain-containing protein